MRRYSKYGYDLSDDTEIAAAGASVEGEIGFNQFLSMCASFRECGVILSALKR
jgi:hypothetical protein